MSTKVKKLRFDLINRLINLSRRKKTILIMLMDYLLLVFSFEASLSIRNNEIFWPTQQDSMLIFITPLIALPLFYNFGLYHSFMRFSSIENIKIIMLGISIYTFLWFLVVAISGVVIKPYDFLIINWLLTIFFVGGIRFLARNILRRNTSDSKNVLIYGAGNAGIRLGSAIQNDPAIKINGFIDDSKEKQGLYYEGIKIFPPEDIESLIEKKNVDEILIAIPSLGKSKLKNLILSLNQLPVVLKNIPDIVDLVSGAISVSDIKRVKIEDLLRRRVRKPDQELLTQDINDKTVMVTGAGGSIGSELSRQIINHSPKKLILLDISEYALYQIEAELLDRDFKAEVKAYLCDVCNNQHLERIMSLNNVDTVFHSAAYKHVPLVEKNVSAGVRYNIIGTKSCVEAAIKTSVESFVFISTDKAVRPPNVMGATKRFAELILQAKSKDPRNVNDKVTRISMVRFGNVLGSSGSVVPLFNKQIKAGGPVTVTDPEMIRYFMTIREAAELVIQAGSMGNNGEVFILDMGEPVKIYDLARDMITLSGMTVKDESNPNGDIEIIFTGKRQGEKLFEELVIDSDLLETKHNSIMRADESYLDSELLDSYIEQLKDAVLDDNERAIKKVLSETVTGFDLNS